MVRLKLRVKVLPPESVGSPSKSRLRTPGDSSANTDAAAQCFLEIVNEPHLVTLGALADMIRARYRKLYKRELEIKKLLDDQHDGDELDADLTVADVFVDLGKGPDQRATVRVLQKPTSNIPHRDMSVVQEWRAPVRPPVPLFPGVQGPREEGENEADRPVYSIEHDDICDAAWSSQGHHDQDGHLQQPAGIRVDPQRYPTNPQRYTIDQLRQRGYVQVHEIPDTPHSRAARTPVVGNGLPSDEAYDTKSETPEYLDMNNIAREQRPQIVGPRQASLIPGLHAAAQDATSGAPHVDSHQQTNGGQHDINMGAFPDAHVVQTHSRHVGSITKNLPTGNLHLPFKRQRPSKSSSQVQSIARKRHLDREDFDALNGAEFGYLEHGEEPLRKRRMVNRSQDGRPPIEGFVPASRLPLDTQNALTAPDTDASMSREALKQKPSRNRRSKNDQSRPQRVRQDEDVYAAPSDEYGNQMDLDVPGTRAREISETQHDNVMEENLQALDAQQAELDRQELAMKLAAAEKEERRLKKNEYSRLYKLRKKAKEAEALRAATETPKDQDYVPNNNEEASEEDESTNFKKTAKSAQDKSKPKKPREKADQDVGPEGQEGIVAVPDSQPSFVAPSSQTANIDLSLLNDPEFQRLARAQSRAISSAPTEQSRRPRTSKAKKPSLNKQSTQPSQDPVPNQDDSPSLGREKPKRTSTSSQTGDEKSFDTTGKGSTSRKRSQSQPASDPHLSKPRHRPILPEGVDPTLAEQLEKAPNTQEEMNLLHSMFPNAADKDLKQTHDKVRHGSSVAVESVSPQGSRRPSSAGISEKTSGHKPAETQEMSSTSSNKARNLFSHRPSWAFSSNDDTSAEKESAKAKSDKGNTSNVKIKSTSTGSLVRAVSTDKKERGTKKTPAPAASNNKKQAKLTDTLKGKQKVKDPPTPLRNIVDGSVVVSDDSTSVHSQHSDPGDPEVHAGPSKRKLAFKRTASGTSSNQGSNSKSKPLETPQPVRTGLLSVSTSAKGKLPNTSLQDAQRDRYRSRPSTRRGTAKEAEKTLCSTNRSKHHTALRPFNGNVPEVESIQTSDSERPDKTKTNAKPQEMSKMENAEPGTQDGEESESEEGTDDDDDDPENSKASSKVSGSAESEKSNQGPKTTGSDKSAAKSPSTSSEESGSEEEDEDIQDAQKTDDISPSGQLNETLSQDTETKSQSESSESTGSEEESDEEETPKPKPTSVTAAESKSNPGTGSKSNSEESGSEETSSESGETESGSGSGESESDSDSEESASESESVVPPQKAVAASKSTNSRVTPKPPIPPSAPPKQPSFIASSQVSQSSQNRPSLADLKLKLSGTNTPNTGKKLPVKPALKPTNLEDMLKNLPSEESDLATDEEESESSSGSGSDQPTTNANANAKRKGNENVRNSLPTPQNSSQANTASEKTDKRLKASFKKLVDQNKASRKTTKVGG